MTTIKTNEPILFCDGASGQFIPQRFASEVRREAVSGIHHSLLDALAEGPSRDDYWDIWCDVCDHAVVTDTDGTVYSLHQDGDLWLLPEGYEGPLLED